MLRMLAIHAASFGCAAVSLRRTVLWTAVASSLIAATPISAYAAVSASSRIGPAGVGPIIIGSTPAQAAATGTRFAATTPAPGSTCYYLTPREPAGLRFLVEDGTLRRAEVSSGPLTTTDGIRVGDPAAKLRERYGSRARAAPDKYDPAVQILTIDPAGPADAKYRMIFRVRGGRIEQIYAGALPQIFYVEGCS